ncbi:hypothetical protein QMK19_40185 [Streptomyces sp. H10-C2]|uniref:hypothetical protein n=1 Tax=unclassified Streptomyces TaxID=2593676 RepID=UPI0024BABEC3|nr:MULTISPECIES: hypothetical protein [unclassified Streptomyces]MDJ0347473.1 hypothetical protein [Streptomyces sp. PH10-H1]MDJ0375636.1 hypothetical protein [Streptomyces sp. H10-C2]
MADLYTKNGKPLRSDGRNVHDASGRHVGRIDGKKVFGRNGRYVATVVGNRLVYRSVDSASIRGPFAASPKAGLASASAVGSAVWGDEPTFN